MSVRVNKYKHVGRRVISLCSGHLGRVVSARPVGKTSWDISVVYDGRDVAVRYSPSDFFKCNELVEDGYAHHLPNERERAMALLSRKLDARLGYYIESIIKVYDAVNCRYGEDRITFNATYPAVLCISLWGGTSMQVDCRNIKAWYSNGDRYQQLAVEMRKNVEAMQ